MRMRGGSARASVVSLVAVLFVASVIAAPVAGAQSAPSATGPFDIAVGSTVSEGVPGPGAGSIGVFCEVDVYRFDAEAGDGVAFTFLDPSELPRSNQLGFSIQLRSPSGELVRTVFHGGHSVTRFWPQWVAAGFRRRVRTSCR